MNFDSTARQAFINGVASTVRAGTGLTTGTGQQYIGFDTFGASLNGEMYYLYVLGISAPDADRILLQY
jgi:hypothetical protein